MTVTAALRDVVGELAAFLLAASCSGCDEPGRLLCERCRDQLALAARVTTTPQGLVVHSALSYEGVAAQCIRQLKGDGQTHLVRPLGGILGAVLSPVLPPSAWAVPVPTSGRAFRRRGYRVPDLLIRAAGADPRRVLSFAARTADQRGLDVRARAENLGDSMRARRCDDATEVVIVDDVVTTGATLDEAARALTASGFRVAAAVVLASTPRRIAL